jgi:hypothetical protein
MRAHAAQHAIEDPMPSRQHPRVRVSLPVEMRCGVVLAIGNTENLSMGGMLLQAPITLDRESDVWLRFNLPNGHSVRTRGSVVHRRADGRIGLSFRELSTPDHLALGQALHHLLGYARRGQRIARRYHVTLRPVGAPESQNELAETVFLSQHGGLLVSRAHFRLLERVWVTWPERQRSAPARIVYRRQAGPGGLAEFGFTFYDVEDFWEL